jgi:hypothetical protein
MKEIIANKIRNRLKHYSNYWHIISKSRKYMEQTGGDPRNLVLEGQGCSISFRMQ